MVCPLHRQLQKVCQTALGQSAAEALEVRPSDLAGARSDASSAETSRRDAIRALP